MNSRKAILAGLLACIATVGNLGAQGHDTYVCASLDVDYVLGSNQSPQNGLFRLMRISQ